MTTVDVSIKAMFTQAMLDAIAKSPNPAARYIAHYSQERYYLWDELAACAWLDPGIITRREDLYMDVDVSHGPAYGETLTWNEAMRPAVDVHLVHARSGSRPAAIHQDVRRVDVRADSSRRCGAEALGAGDHIAVTGPACDQRLHDAIADLVSRFERRNAPLGVFRRRAPAALLPAAASNNCSPCAAPARASSPRGRSG